MLEYCALTPECNLKSESARLKEWPTKGLIEFKNLYAKYNQTAPYSLQNINLVIHPGEKVQNFMNKSSLNFIIKFFLDWNRW